jgi:hypothetical protein
MKEGMRMKLKVGDYVVVKKLIADVTIYAKKSIGKVGRVIKISDKKSVKYPIEVKFIKPLGDSYNGISYDKEELKKIKEKDILAYLI